MSAAVGQKQTSRHHLHYVRFTPKSGQIADISRCPLCAKSGQTHRSKKRCYSIISSARIISDSGMSMPSSLAALRLMTSANRVDCSTGRVNRRQPVRDGKLDDASSRIEERRAWKHEQRLDTLARHRGECAVKLLHVVYFDQLKSHAQGARRGSLGSYAFS